MARPLNKEMVRLIMAGDLNDYEIARRVGYGHQYVSKVRGRLDDAPASPGNPSYKRMNKARATELIMLGTMSTREIAKEMGVAPSTIERFRPKVPDAPPPPPRKKKYDEAEARVLIRSRLYSDAEIGRMVGVDRSTISNVREHMNLPSLDLRINHEYDEDLERMAAQRVTIRRQAELIGKSERFVERARTRLKLTGRGPNAPISEEKKKEVERMLDDGMSFGEIARTTGVSTRWIGDHFPGRGWTQKQAAEHRYMLKKAREAGIDL